LVCSVLVLEDDLKALDSVAYTVINLSNVLFKSLQLLLIAVNIEKRNRLEPRLKYEHRLSLKGKLASRDSVSQQQAA